VGQLMLQSASLLGHKLTWDLEGMSFKLVFVLNLKQNQTILVSLLCI